MKAATRQYTGAELDRAVRFGAFLLVLASALSLFLTQRMVIPGSLLTIASAIAWKWQKQNWGNFWEIASFGYLLFFILDLFRISGSLAPSLVHLFTFILINKLFNLRSSRDYYQLFLLTFLTVLAATSISVEIEMFYMIVAYIVLLVWNIASLTLYREWMQSREAYFPFSLFSFPYLLLVFVATVFTFGCAMAIFFVMPRMQLGFFSNLKQQKIQYVSGFSQKVELGEISSIQSDPDVAMRVRISGGDSQKRATLLKYWRGIAFDHYDGKSWSSTVPGGRPLFDDSSNYFFAAKFTGPREALIHQEFFMEPLDTRVIFGLDRVVRFHGTFGQMRRDGNGTFTSTSRPKTYEVWSVQPDFQQIKQGPDTIPDSVRRYYLQLPVRSSRIESLARQVTAIGKSNFERAIVLRNYLQKTYVYSTSDLPAESSDPVSEFLFVKKTGHCEYFASSMVVLLRHLGIPARLVNGFREGEYNSIGDFYIIRNSDAHSWAEAYVGGQWVLMDASPIESDTSTFSLFAFLNPRRILDSLSFFWDRYILIYSGQDQIDALEGIQDQYRAIRGKLRERYPLAEPPSAILVRLWKASGARIALVFIGGILLFVAARLWIRRRHQTRMSRTPILFYQEMLSILSKKGYTRPVSATPAEFLKTIEPRIPPEGRLHLQKLTDLFYRARFGGYTLTTADQFLVRSSLRQLQQW